MNKKLTFKASKLVEVPDAIEVKNKGGRPKKPIDENVVYGLAKIHCTNVEIAAVIGIHVDTLAKRGFSELIEKGKEEGKSSLRRLQWKQAERGNVQMLIWLGKQMLGQRDKQPDEAPQTIFNVKINEIPK